VWQQVYDHMLQLYVSCVSDVCYICFNVAKVDAVLCCNGYTRMLQTYVSNVSAVSNVYGKCFI
jgi:hypothetical protein